MNLIMSNICKYLFIIAIINVLLAVESNAQSFVANNYQITCSGTTAFIDYKFTANKSLKYIEFIVERIKVKDTNSIFLNLNDKKNFCEYYSQIINNFLSSNPNNFIQLKFQDSIETISLKRKICWYKNITEDSNYFEILPCDCNETATTKIFIENIQGRVQLSIRDEIPEIYESICNDKIILNNRINCMPFRCFKE